MARGKKTEPMKEIDGSELPELKPQEFEFISLLMFDASVKGDASEAYRRAFPDRSHKNVTVWCEASKLKRSPHIRQWIASINLAQMNRLDATREQYISDVVADIQAAQAAGNFGAAATLRIALGKVYGHLIERSEDVNRTRDQIVSLKSMAKSLGQEQALELADKIGMRAELVKELALAETAGNA